ncbi:MAG: helix-hairpin-helix domain-containing protein [Bacteroidaceae bacterium]|nr:helix-hairpin-helix domain-containing protein [Bacteroidaceae bacterium]
MRTIFLLLIINGLILPIEAQNIPQEGLDWLKDIQELSHTAEDNYNDDLENQTESIDGSELEGEDNYYKVAESLQNKLEELQEKKGSPLDLNAVTKEELEELPFLSDLQIEKLLEYLYVNHGMASIYELQLVPEMDYKTLQTLLPYITLHPLKEGSQPPTLKEMCRFGNHEITTRLDLPLYTKEGYKQHDAATLADNPNKQYLGPSWYHSLRYAFHYKDQLYWGLTAEKDAGEEFFRGSNQKGYDSYSPYFLLRNRGRLKALALGKYRVTFGLGLCVGSEFLFGKSNALTTFSNSRGGFKKHSGTDEYNYFRGFGGSFLIKPNATLSAFYSNRSLDGIANDSCLTSISKTGKHTIPREIERKDVATLKVIGGNYNYQSSSYHLGITAIQYTFNTFYNPTYREYNKYYFRGRKGHNISTDYRFRKGRLQGMGEFASDHNGKTAMLHILRVQASPGFQYILLYRNYNKAYQDLFAESFSEGGTVQNENGFYLGAQKTLKHHLQINGFVDFFRFPWLRYQIDGPSSGHEFMGQATYSPSPKTIFIASYRSKKKEKNYTSPEDKTKAVLPYLTHRIKLQLNHAFNSIYTSKTSYQNMQVGTQGISPSRGWLMSETISYKSRSKRVTFDCTYATFHTDGYASRIASYERGVLYSFYTPSFYGKGTRLAFMMRYNLSPKWTCYVKYGQTIYSDRESIGSGLEQIDGKKKADLSLQLCWKIG